MMDGTPAVERSTGDKVTVVLASLGLRGLCYGVFTTLLAMIPLPLWFLYIEVAEVSVLSPRVFFSYLAIVVAAAFAGWSLPTKGWLYGLIAGACGQLAGVGPSIVALSRLWVNLRGNPDIIYQLAGNPPLGIVEQWLIFVLIPLVAGAALGAAGGFVGQLLRGRRQARSAACLDTWPNEHF